MRRSAPVVLAAVAAAALVAGGAAPAFADEEPPAPAPAAAPAAPPQGEPAAATPSAVRAAPRYTLGNWMLHAHLDAGAEPHPDFACGSGDAATCSVVAFGVGGQLLWRGTLGFGLGLYVAQGSATLAGKDQLAIGDRISGPVSLAVRPLGARPLTHGDTFVNRLLAGISIEVGPALEYRRSSGTPLRPPCTIPGVDYTVAFHGALSVDVPLLGNTQGGWLALRLAGRVTAGPSSELAPTQSSTDPECRAQVHIPGVATQLFAGLSYYL